MSMNLLDIPGRTQPPEPWAEGDNIPWHDPDFSRRMLNEHLSQEHDAASRRTPPLDYIHAQRAPLRGLSSLPGGRQLAATYGTVPRQRS